MAKNDAANAPRKIKGLHKAWKFYKLLRLFPNPDFRNLLLEICKKYFLQIYGSPQFNTSVPHKTSTPFQPQKSLSSTLKTLRFKPKTPQFHTKNPSVPHTSQFHTLLSSTPKTPQFNTLLSSPPKGVWNWGVFRVELRDFGDELRGFWCWNEKFLVLKRCGPCVEPMRWTEGVCVVLRGTPNLQRISESSNGT